MNEYKEQSFPPEEGAVLPMTPFAHERYSPHDLYMVVWSGLPNLNNAETKKLAEVLALPENVGVRNQIAEIIRLKHTAKPHEVAMLLEQFRAGNLDAALEIDDPK